MSFMTKCRERLVARLARTKLVERLARTKLVTKYKERVDLKYGWEVELECPRCSHDGLPKYCDGWTPKPGKVLNYYGNTHMICANVACAECGHDLKERAGEKLKEVFKDVPKTTFKDVPKATVGALGVVMAIPLLLLPFVVAVLATTGAIEGWLADWLLDWIGWWFWPSFLVCMLIYAIIALILNYMTQPLWYACECGKPRFLFMGILGHSYCFRCSSCARLLRRGW